MKNKFKPNFFLKMHRFTLSSHQSFSKSSNFFTNFFVPHPISQKNIPSDRENLQHYYNIFFIPRDLVEAAKIKFEI